MPLSRDPITDPCLTMMPSEHQIIPALPSQAPLEALPGPLAESRFASQARALSSAKRCEHHA